MKNLKDSKKAKILTDSRITKDFKILKNLTVSKNSKLFLVFKIFLIFFIIFTLIFIFYDDFLYLINNYNNENNYANVSLNNNSQQANSSSNTESKISDVNFSLVATGDILCHNTQYFDAYNKTTGQYDFNYVFENVVKYIEPADIAISSLETTFAGQDRGYSNYPTFNSPDSLITAVKNAGVDIISTAGNHCLDYGFSGLTRTIDVLNENGLDHLGTYKSADEQNSILYKDIENVKIAFLNYTYGTNGIPIPNGKEFCVNLIDKDFISNQIEKAKNEGADVIVACMHWGTEYLTTQNEEQEELADFLFQNGVDIIIGNHPHVAEPMEKRTVTLDDGTEKDCFVIYALGNFTADQNYANTRSSVILNLDLTYTADEKLLINSATYTPIYIYENPNVSYHKFKLIDMEDAIYKYESSQDTSIGASLYNTLKKELSTITSIVGPEINS